jgi:hypothetical protein
MATPTLPTTGAPSSDEQSDVGDSSLTDEAMINLRKNIDLLEGELKALVAEYNRVKMERMKHNSDLAREQLRNPNIRPTELACRQAIFQSDQKTGLITLKKLIDPEVLAHMCELGRTSGKASSAAARRSTRSSCISSRPSALEPKRKACPSSWHCTMTSWSRLFSALRARSRSTAPRCATT